MSYGLELAEQTLANNAGTYCSCTELAKEVIRLSEENTIVKECLLQMQNAAISLTAQLELAQMEIENTRLTFSNTHNILPDYRDGEISIGKAIELLNAELKKTARECLAKLETL